MPVLQRLILPLLLVAGAAAQGTPVAGSGCEFGLSAPWLTGSTRIGEDLTITCNTPTASTRTWLLVGACVQPWALPEFVSCRPGCKLGVGLPVIVVPRARGGLTVRLPADPSLVGLDFCIQCVESIFGGCLTASQATRITVRD